MKNAKFWLVQIAMVAIVALVFSSAGFAEKPAKVAKTANAEEMSHGEMNRLDKANMENGNAAWKTGGTDDPAECAEEDMIWVGGFDENGNFVTTLECP